MKNKLNIMAVVCHPADAIDGAGGTLCKHALRGDNVSVVVCTHGVDTHDLKRNDLLRFGEKSGLHKTKTGSDKKQAIGRKEKEVVKGMKLLGVTDVRFLRFPDELLTVTTDLIIAIAKEMADIQPHLLILHNPTEELGIADVGHADTAVSALKARYLANTGQYLKKPAGRIFPAQTFFMVMNGQTSCLTTEGERYGNVLVDITSVIDRKVAAMDCLESQYYPGELGRKCIETVNGRMGLHNRMSYAEAFQSHKPDGYEYLPANPHRMWIAETPAGSQMKRLKIMIRK
ncbi:MAG: PIG-L deacetylase family protein [Elusimicrobiota bacterium]